MRTLLAAAAALLWLALPAGSQVPPEERGTSNAERSGYHDASNIRTVFWNYGMVGDYPADPGRVDLSVFHSVEVPKGSGMNYSDGITPFVLAKIQQKSGQVSYIMETGFRERQGISPFYNRVMRFEPRPGFFQADPAVNAGRSPAVSNDPRTWPAFWPDKALDPSDPGWAGSWNGYFGKRIVADQESYMVMDDNFYDAWDFQPDSLDATRRGLGLRIEVRGFQWANPQARNVVFWHYDITNEGTTDYDDNIIFGLYMDSGVGGSAFSCDQIFESDDDNAFFDRKFNEDILNLVYTWDNRSHGIDLSGDCGRTGYLGYAYLETPGNALDHVDNDEDGVTDEQRDSEEGTKLTGEAAIRAHVGQHYDLARFEATYGPLEQRPAFRAGEWWTGDEDMDWVAESHDTGVDGVFTEASPDSGEGDGIPTAGEPSFDQTDLNESDQIGLTGFKFNRIKPGTGNPDREVDGILFYTEASNWPQRLYSQFTNPDPQARFDPPLTTNYNIGFLFASGPFKLRAGKTERFSLALAYGADLNELRRTVKTVQQIYNANYRFAVPPPLPTLTAETGDGYVRLSWDTAAERGSDPVTGEADFEGYRIYRSTDPEFRDPKVITTGTGSEPIGNGRPIAQFDIPDGRNGFSTQVVEGVAYYLGSDNGITHTWTDTTVINGQLYYYAVCAYDFGSDTFDFYPSESSIGVSRTARGGVVLAPNVVEVRPNPRVAGFVAATPGTPRHVSGKGTGTVEVEVVNSDLVPDGHGFRLTFTTPAPESLRATAYSLTDVTDDTLLFFDGRDFAAMGVGPVGSGILPLVSSPERVLVDTSRTGFTPESATNVDLRVQYETSLHHNLRRPAYPEDLIIVFEDEIVDTSQASFPLTPYPARFRVFWPQAADTVQLDFQFEDKNGDGTLSWIEGSSEQEFVDILTYAADAPTVGQPTWLLVPVQPPAGTVSRPPRRGDVFRIVLEKPFSADDVFEFEPTGQRVDATAAASTFDPYVVPNPYIASAIFEPERFAVSGRGDRRLEFRGLPGQCTIRIFTVMGELVQTLAHDGSTEGYVAWDLRTKDNLDVAPGLYLFHVDGGSAGRKIGKFAIIK